MNTHVKRFFAPIVIFTLAAVASGSLLVSTSIYKQAMHIQSEAENLMSHTRIGTFKRVVRIISADHGRGIFVAESINPEVVQTVSLEFVADESTIIERQDPVVEDGVIVGFSRHVNPALSDITVGSVIFARFSVADTGRLFARNITIGDPFPTP